MEEVVAPTLVYQDIEKSEAEEIGRIADEDVEQTVSDEIFSRYTHKDVLPGCRSHPGDIVEAGSLSALQLPDTDYPLADSLPENIITSGLLSSLQLEGVIYACRRHQMILPNGTRAGFFLGDGAGVGKGRQISGIILDNFIRGRTKHIWFSISTDLIVDARRDLGDLGCYINVIDGCQQLDKENKVFGLPKDFREGVIFSTYATLVSSATKGGPLSSTKQSRLQQLIDWCGGPLFDGCLIFDECHKAKNFIPGKEASSTKVAVAVSAIQKLLPKARVVYCSATGVTDVKHMAFMERLGLWGEGAAFSSFVQFLETVQKKGLGVAEMLAMEMKSTGMYVSRGLSFRQTEFKLEEVVLTEEQIRMYNTAAHVWNELRKSLEHSIQRTGYSGTRVWTVFWGAHQRFFKQLCMGIKVDDLVKQAQQALDNDMCVVIGLQTTGEASLVAEMNRSNVPLSGFVSLCREIMKSFIIQHYPTVIEGKTSDQGDIEDTWSKTAKHMLLGFAEKITLPNSPLDDIIDKLGGPDNVSEMTGRGGRIVRRSPGGSPQYEQRGSNTGVDVDSLNVQERNQFMSGEKLVAIISDAASTGISLHADLRAENQKRRVHITLELPWSADKAVQQLGRSHRSNQSSGPLYKLLTTNLGGERRFAAAVARRLQSLGALTKGDRRAATGADLSSFNFDTPYGRAALKSMYNAICQKQIAPGVAVSHVTSKDFVEFNDIMLECLDDMGLLLGSSFTTQCKVIDNVQTDVGRFLNRILGLKVQQQNLIFQYFCACLDAGISHAKKEGRFNEGLVDIVASSVSLAAEPRTVFDSKTTKHNTTKHIILDVDRGMSWDKALIRLKNNPGTGSGFYISRRDRRDAKGQKFVLLATPKDGAPHTFKIARPNTGVSSFDEDKTDLLHKYIPIDQESAEVQWTQLYGNSENQCIHGPRCKNSQFGRCTVGARCYRIHLLCGGIVTMMSLLETTLARYGPQLHLTKWEMTLRVVRIQLESGERVVGIRYPEMLIPMAEKLFVEQQTQQTLTNLLQQSQDSLNSTQQTSSDKSVIADQAVIEKPAPVSERCKNKAFTPPVTIKNFFKPKFKPEIVNSESNPESVNSESNLKTVISESDLKSVDSDSNIEIGNMDTKLGNGKSNSSGNSETMKRNGLSGSVLDFMCNGESSSENISRTSSSSNLTNGTTSSSSLINRTSSNLVNGFSKAKTSTGTKQGTKRKSESSSSNNKKPKQGTLFAAFAKVKNKEEEKEEKSRTCPICAFKFDKDASNGDINAHVDNCLIE